LAPATHDDADGGPTTTTTTTMTTMTMTMATMSVTTVTTTGTRAGGRGRAVRAIRGGGGGARRAAIVARAEVDPQSLAILQQKLGQQITFEGAGAEQLNKGVLLDAGGRAMGKDKGIQKSASEQALEIAYDPDGLFPEVDESSASMMIDRRLGMRQAEMDAEMEEEMKKKHEEARAELQAARDARVQPGPEDPEALVKYFFETEMNEMEYEIVRCRPLLVDSFFQHLQQTVDASEGLEKEKREALYTVTSNFVGFVDQTTRAMLQPQERMIKLLTAKDKKAMILEMVETGELDVNLMALLKTNENTARQAGRTQEADFMKKIYNACAKFVSV